MTGVGLLLTSYASAIWQMYLSYGVYVLPLIRSIVRGGGAEVAPRGFCSLTGIFLSFMFLPAVSTVQTVCGDFSLVFHSTVEELAFAAVVFVPARIGHRPSCRRYADCAIQACAPTPISQCSGDI